MHHYSVPSAMTVAINLEPRQTLPASRQHNGFREICLHSVEVTRRPAASPWRASTTLAKVRHLRVRFAWHRAMRKCFKHTAYVTACRCMSRHISMLMHAISQQHTVVLRSFARAQESGWSSRKLWPAHRMWMKTWKWQKRVSALLSCFDWSCLVKVKHAEAWPFQGTYWMLSNLLIFPVFTFVLSREEY